MDIRLEYQAASFTTAPPEVLLQIAKAVPDLRSLYHLALAVPPIYRIWKPYGSEILRVVTSNRKFTTPQVRDLIWLVALLRSDEMPVWSFDTFLERFVRPTMVMNCPPEPPCVVPTPTSCPFGVLGTASRIYYLTQSCTEYYLERLRAVQPRLQRPIDLDFDYEAPYGPYKIMVPGWLRQTEGVFYKTPSMGPSFWVEEQVVLRAFWRLQLLHEFRWAAKESRINTWSSSDVGKIAHLQLEELFPCMHPHMIAFHEIVSVQEYLQEFYKGSHLTQVESAEGKARLSEIPEDDWHIVRRSGSIWQFQYAPGGLLLPPIHSTLHKLITLDESPIKGVSFSTYRRLGFALWDDQRQAALQLAQAPRKRGQVGVREFYVQPWFSWRSLLSEDELAEVVKRLADAESDATRQARLNCDRCSLG